MSTIEVPNVAPATYVSPPTREGLRFGLFSVANMISNPESRWEMGVEWEPFDCGMGGAVSVVCDEPAGVPIEIENGDGVGELVNAQPFAVFGRYRCSAFSRSLDEAEERARAHLALIEERQVERAIMHGDVDNTSTFVGATDLTPGAGDAVPVHEGLGLLEEYLGTTYGGQGVVHLPRRLGPHATSGLISRQGQRLETMLGTLVAAGAGYDVENVGPDGTPAGAGERWVYATGRPHVRRSDVFVMPDADHYLDRENNDVSVIAQRLYAVGWECATGAVLVQTAESA